MSSRLERERAGDVDPLPLSTGLLVRVTAGEQGRTQPDLVEQALGALARRSGRQPLGGTRAEGDDVADRGAGFKDE
jgi:hypothetical protein